MLDLFLLKEALVVDPVMVSTSGDILAGPSVLAGFRYELLILNLNYAASVWREFFFILFSLYARDMVPNVKQKV